MEERNLTCIGCPMGCQVIVRMEGGEVKEVTGNTCKRGETYAIDEVTNPTRTVTSTVKVANSDEPMVSVKTAAVIPKDKIFDCIDALRGIEVKAPVRIGDVIVADVCGTGVDVVATGNVGLSQKPLGSGFFFIE